MTLHMVASPSLDSQSDPIPTESTSDPTSSPSSPLPKAIQDIYSTLDQIHIRGNWEFDSGNYILRPPPDIKPLAVIHFAGGAFIGTIPHLAYNYMLESLCQRGYVIVATPFRIAFDHLLVVNNILSTFDQCTVSLALDYGELPIIPVGHSAGALFHSLALSLFPSCKRSAAIFISYNNMQASDAIPLFQPVIVPLLTAIYAQQNQNPELRERIQSLLRIPARVETSVEEFVRRNGEFLPKFLQNEVLTSLKETRTIPQQIEPILDEISEGMTEFTPTSKECKDALEKMYCADHSLIIKFRSDPIDESEKLENALRKRMDSADSEVKSVTMETLFGSHTSPATPDVFLKDKVPFLEECAPEWMKRVREPVRKYVLRDVDQAIDLIDEWILKRIENNEV